MTLQFATRAQLGRAIVHDLIDDAAERTRLELGILAAAHRSALAGKDFERSLGALRRWRLPKGGDHGHAQPRIED